MPLSPALSQVVTEPGPIAGRKIGIIADAGADLAGIGKIRKAAAKLGATVLVIAPVGGVLGSGTHTQTVDRTLLTARSVEFDALVVAGGTAPTGDIKLTLLLQEAFRHCKVLAAWGDGTAVLEAAGITAGGAGWSRATPPRSPSPTSSPRRSACTGPGTGRPTSWPPPSRPSSHPDHLPTGGTHDSPAGA